MEIRSIGPFLDYWGNVRQRTLCVAACIPPARIEWAPRPGRFTFGDQLRHLAAVERWMFAENARRRPSAYPGHGRELADGYGAVMAYVEGMHGEAVQILAELTESDLAARCATPGGASVPVWKWLRAMVEHEAHHRGQIYQMLGMLDVSVPQIYGLTEEEVLARSVPLGAGTAP